MSIPLDLNPYAFSIGVTAAAQAASVTVGTAASNDGNCFPFTCFQGRYQQVYSSSSFSVPLNIEELSFFNTAYQPGTAVVSNANFKISLSTITKGLNQLESTADNNVGADTQTFFEGILGGATGTKFSISGNSFSYDPSKGNLLLDVIVSNVTSFGSGYLDMDFTGSQTTRLYNGTSDSSGLVTQFSGTNGAQAVPTPALLPGLIGLGAAALRKRKQEKAEA